MSTGSYIYGIDDQNDIWEIRVTGTTISASEILDTGLTGMSNAFAYDTARNLFYFIDPTNSLRVWDRSAAPLGTVASSAELGLETLDPGASPAPDYGNKQPASGALYAGSFWFFKKGGDTKLYRAELTADGKDLQQLTSYTVTGDALTGESIPDFAIDDQGNLYGTDFSGHLFKIDLFDETNNRIYVGGFTSSFVNPSASPFTPNLQLSFSADYSVLYGQDYDGVANDGNPATPQTPKWYSVNLTTGAATELYSSPSELPALRDLGGASPTAAALTVNDVSVNENSPYAVFTVTGVSGLYVDLDLIQMTPGIGVATLGTDTVTPDVTAAGLLAGSGLQVFDGINNIWVAYSEGLGTGTNARLFNNQLLVRIALRDDVPYEGPEDFQITARYVSVPIVSDMGTGRIYDDGRGEIYPNNTTGATDPTAPRDDDRRLSVNSITVNEASPYAVFTVTVEQDLAFTLTLASGTATLGVDTANAGAGVPLQVYNGTSWVDYTPGSAITAASSSLLVCTKIVNDPEHEGPHTFTLTAAYTLDGRNATGTCTINDEGQGAI